jgi:hypothetical protein
MIQNIVRDIGGIAVFGIISVCLFFTVFGAAMIFALLQKKSFCKSMSALPLEDGMRGEHEQ